MQDSDCKLNSDPSPGSKRKNSQEELVESNEEKISQQCESENDGKAKKQKCELVNNILEEDDSDDDWPPKMDPKKSTWWSMYVQFPRKGEKQFEKLFKRRFGMSYSSFEEHLDEVRNEKQFASWIESEINVTGRFSRPIEVLLLGTLRHLKRGFSFDDLEEQTFIPEEVYSIFVQTYKDWKQRV